MSGVEMNEDLNVFAPAASSAGHFTAGAGGKEEETQRERHASESNKQTAGS